MCASQARNGKQFIFQYSNHLYHTICNLQWWIKVFRVWNPRWVTDCIHFNSKKQQLKVFAFSETGFKFQSNTNWIGPETLSLFTKICSHRMISLLKGWWRENTQQSKKNSSWMGTVLLSGLHHTKTRQASKWSLVQLGFESCQGSSSWSSGM